MALDLTFKSRGEREVSCYKEDKVCVYRSDVKEDDHNNNSMMMATDLTLPGRERQCDSDQTITSSGIELNSLISPPRTPPSITSIPLSSAATATLMSPPNLAALTSSTSNLSQEQIQLDIAALNLLCLARLQETAAVLTGRRPLPAHMSSSSPSSIPLVTSTNSNRRNHKCDEPGCDKVCNVYTFCKFICFNCMFIIFAHIYKLAICFAVVPFA